MTQPGGATPDSPQAREAVADLAARLGVAEDQVVVTQVEEVTWRDTSLGCAEDGMRYAQMLVEGSRITLQAGGRRYEYHSGGRQGAFLCEHPTQ